MKKRRIQVFLTHKVSPSFLVNTIEETDDYFMAKFCPMPHCCGCEGENRKCFNDGRMSAVDYIFDSFRWKPHEYRQEARRACLISYWIFKKLLGRDLAGLIAKYVWSTRFDFIWENNEE